MGRNADSLARLPVKYFGAGLHEAGVVLSKLVPNLQLYVPPRPLLTGEVIAPKLSVHIGLAAAYGLAWTIGLLTVAALVFRRRDFL